MSSLPRKPKRNNSILNYLKPVECPNPKPNLASPSNVALVEEEEKYDIEPRPFKASRLEPKEVEATSSYERDPGLRAQIYEYPVNERDDVRRAYMKMGPYQTKSKKWFKQFPWLEYSPTTNNVYCFPCFLFETNPPKYSTFTIEGFRSWKRVNEGKSCSLLQHVGGPSSYHMKAVGSYEDLKKSSHYIDQVLSTISKEDILKARLLRDSGWNIFLACVISFCKKHEIQVPDFDAPHKTGTGRACHQLDVVTIEHYYRISIFTSLIDNQYMKLSSRFTDEAMELLKLSTTLDPKDNFKLFNSDDICKLATKFYSQDFTKQEISVLRCQLLHYELDVARGIHFQNMKNISELCQGLVETQKSEAFYLIDRLIRLVLTLPVSTATTERSFSAMKLVKSQLRNKMDDEPLADCMVLYIEKEFIKKIDVDSVIDEFDGMKDRRTKFK